MIFLNLFFAIASAEEDFDPFASSLINTQNLLPTTIQSVSAISGEWLESETDFIVQGHDPLILTRSYSANYSHGKLGYNWEFNRPHKLRIYNITPLKSKHELLRARLHHSSGVKTIHKIKDPSGAFYMPLSQTKGLTNCRCGEISGRTNLHNISLKVNAKRNTCDVTTGDGHHSQENRGGQSHSRGFLLSNGEKFYRWKNRHPYFFH